MTNKASIQKEATQIFLRAAEYIKTYGWQKSGMSIHGKPRCSMGALESANPAPIWNKDLASLMYETLYKELNGVSLTEFNKRAKDGLAVAQLFEQVARTLS